MDKFTYMYYRMNNVNDKKMIVAINDHGQFYCFKQIQLVVCKFDTICKDIQRESISLFSI